MDVKNSEIIKPTSCTGLVSRQINVYFVSCPDRNPDNQYFTTVAIYYCVSGVKKVMAFMSDKFGQIEFVLFLNDHHVFPSD